MRSCCEIFTFENSLEKVQIFNGNLFKSAALFPNFLLTYSFIYGNEKTLFLNTKVFQVLFNWMKSQKKKLQIPSPYPSVGNSDIVYGFLSYLLWSKISKSQKEEENRPSATSYQHLILNLTLSIKMWFDLAKRTRNIKQRKWIEDDYYWKHLDNKKAAKLN